jgi:Transposase DDE domain
MPLVDKRSLIETVNDELKNICQIEHSRHRSVFNFRGNIVAGLAAYTHLEKKPALNLDLSPLPRGVSEITTGRLINPCPELRFLTSTQ